MGEHFTEGLRLATEVVCDDAVAARPLEGVYTHTLLAPEWCSRGSDMSCRSRDACQRSVASEPLLDGFAQFDLVATLPFGYATTKHEGDTRLLVSPVCDGAIDPASYGVPGSLRLRPCVPWSG